MGINDTVSIDVIYLRRLGFIGGILLLGITSMNLFIETGTVDFPIPRVIIAVAILGFAISSYYFSWVRTNGMILMYGVFFVYNFYGIALVAVNNFQALDTSATILIGFALCAFIRKKNILNLFLAFLLVTYLGFYFTASNPEIPMNYFLMVLLFLLSMAYMVFNGKITTENVLESNRIRLERSERLFRNIFEKSPIGIFLMDVHQNRIKINHVLCETIGYTRQEFLELHPSVYTHKEDYIDYKELYKRLAKAARSSNNGLVLEQRFYTKSGTIKWVRLTMALISVLESKERYIISMAEDISFQKQAENQLNTYAQKLKQHNQALEEFSYVVSHDLQEPLRMIRSYTGLIKKRYISKIEDDNAAIDMDFVIDGAERMSLLIKDMLSYSRYTTKSLELEYIDTSDILINVVKNLSVAIAEKQGEIIYDEMPVIRTNKLLLGQVLQNLIGNGLKYSFPGRNPKIRIRCERRTEDVIFSIQDNGQGFDNKDCDRIFGIFQRLHARDSQYEGTGIGLAICKRIIEKHEGKIWAESEPGVGSTFYFTLPQEEKIISTIKKPKRKLQWQQ